MEQKRKKARRKKFKERDFAPNLATLFLSSVCLDLATLCRLERDARRREEYCGY